MRLCGRSISGTARSGFRIARGYDPRNCAAFGGGTDLVIHSIMRLRGKVQAALVTAALASACVTGAVHPAAPPVSDVESRASAGLFFSPLDLVAAQALLSAPESLPTAQQALAQT